MPFDLHMTISIQLADAIQSSEALLLRYLDGFDDSSAYAQAPGLPNHAAWILGHLALTLHRAAERVTGRSIDLGWDPEPFAFGSTPAVDGPPLGEMLARFRRAMAVLVEAAGSLDDDRLGATVSWGRGETTARDLLARMIFHNGTHCGQLIDLRRALGMDKVFRP